MRDFLGFDFWWYSMYAAEAPLSAYNSSSEEIKLDCSFPPKALQPTIFKLCQIPLLRLL